MAISSMYPAMPGSPKTTLTAEIAADATSMTVANASALPAAPNICVLGDDENAEVVSYSNITGTTVSGLVRGLGGTTASVWPENTIVARNFTSFDHDRFILNIEDLDNRKIDGVSWGDVTGDLADQTDLQTELDLKAPIESPIFTGTPAAPTAAASTDDTQIATTAFVHSRGVYHITGSISAGTTKTFSAAGITASMRVINLVFGTPASVASTVSWTTAAGSVTLTATFAQSTTVDFDLMESDTMTVS